MLVSLTKPLLTLEPCDQLYKQRGATRSYYSPTLPYTAPLSAKLQALFSLAWNVNGPAVT